MNVSKRPLRSPGPIWPWLTICLLLMLALGVPGAARGAEAPFPAATPAARPPLQAATDQLELAPHAPEGPAPSLPGAGYLPFPLDLSHLTARSLPRGASPHALPGHWDWRDEGKVSPVRDQGACGACYAFGAVANFESRLLIDGAGAFDLSENHAKECNWKELNDFRYPFTQPWGSCDGGNYLMAASLFSQQGAVLEECDPYVDRDVACQAACPYEKTVLDWRIISGGAIPDPEVLKHYIYNHGPIATTMYADAYKGFDDSYDGSYTFDYTVAGDAINHGVLIVGWSNDLPPLRGENRPATGWIVKNSWGAGWGDGGYFYAVYGAANLGLGSSFIHSWQDYDPGGEVWYYDDDGWWDAIGKLGGRETTIWGLARFLPPRDTNVTRVEFWTTGAASDVDVYLYGTFDGSAPGNLLASILDNAFAEAGYHSVRVDPPLAVTGGDEIVAVVKFTNEVFGYPLAVDPHGPIETARTYASLTGAAGSWIDLGQAQHTDAAIRLRTSTGLPPAPWITTVTPDFGLSTGAVQAISLEGRHFQPGAAVKLLKAGQPEVPASNVQVAGATHLTCDFDLAGAASGLWDLVVTNPDGQAGTLPAGFAVAAGGQKIWKGSASADWHTAANWTPGGVPAAGDDVLILDVPRDPRLGAGDAAVGDLVLEPGAILDLGSARLTVEGTLTNLGTLKQAQVVAAGATARFLRIANQAGTQIKYHGLDITPAQPAANHAPCTGAPPCAPLVASTTAAATAPPAENHAPGTGAGPCALTMDDSPQMPNTITPTMDITPPPPVANHATCRGARPCAPLVAPTTAAATAPPAATGNGWEVAVSVSGGQPCPGRTTGVSRCFDVTALPALQATVRFYFRDAERDGLALDDLVAYHHGARWQELPGPYSRGGSGEALYVEVEGVDGFSPFALDLPGRGTQLVHLPLVLKQWAGGPEPYVTPTPSPTPDADGPYVVDSTAFAPYETSKSTYLVGQVANPLDRKATFVKIYTTFYDEQGNPLDSDYTYTCIANLAPGMTAPFINAIGNLPVSSWTTYTLAVDWRNDGDAPLPLEVLGEASHFDAEDAFHVTGTARNPHNMSLRFNQACVAMLDGAGKTIGVWWDDVAALDPGAMDDFDVRIYFWKGKPDRGLLGGYTLDVYAEYGPLLQDRDLAATGERQQKLADLQRLLALDAARSR